MVKHEGCFLDPFARNLEFPLGRFFAGEARVAGSTCALGSPDSMRDSNLGRGEDDYPAELYGEHNTATGIEGLWPRAAGGFAPPPDLHREGQYTLIYTGRAQHFHS